MLLQLCSKSLKNTCKEVQMSNKLKLNPCTGVFKDFVENCKAANFEKHLSLVAFVLFSRAFFTSSSKVCEKSVAQLEPSQTSKMELSAKIFNGSKLSTIFAERFHLRYLTTPLKKLVKWPTFSKITDKWHVSFTKQSKQNAPQWLHWLEFVTCVRWKITLKTRNIYGFKLRYSD